MQSSKAQIESKDRRLQVIHKQCLVEFRLGGDFRETVPKRLCQKKRFPKVCIAT